MFETTHISLPALVVLSLSLATTVQAEEPKATTPAASQTAIPEQPEATGPAATQSTPSEKSRAALQERAERYWAARQARDVRTLYELESAAQPGGWLKLEHAMSLQGLPVRKVQVEDVRIEGDRGITRISAEVMIGTIGWTRQTIEDPWVLLDSQWYHETYRP